MEYAGLSSSASSSSSSSFSSEGDKDNTIDPSTAGPKTLACYRPPRPSSSTSNYYYNRLKETRFSSPSICYRLGHYFILAATYFAILVLTAFVITCMFCLFLAIRFIDDMMKSFVPGRIWSAVRGRVLAVDWPGALNRWSSHLGRLADWEKTRRSSLNPSFSQRFANIDGDGLHAFISSFTGLLGGLTSNSNGRRWRWHQQEQSPG